MSPLVLATDLARSNALAFQRHVAAKKDPFEGLFDAPVTPTSGTGAQVGSLSDQDASQQAQASTLATQPDLSAGASPAPSTPPPAPAAAAPAPSPTPQITDFGGTGAEPGVATPGAVPGRGRPSQFAMDLSSADAYAACGPAAAIGFARAFGRNPTNAEAMELARQVGWTQANGMAGVASEQKLLSNMGVPTKLEQNTDWGHVAQDAGNGNPVIISTPGHYFFVDDYHDGKFHVGTSGTDLKGGSEWMTPGEMHQRMGPDSGALYADNPTSPAPSVANRSSDTGVPTTAGLSGGGPSDSRDPRNLLGAAASAASWLGDQGVKALQAVIVTEGGLNNARGDNGSSAGPLQFFGEEGGRGGQLNAYAAYLGLSLAQTRDAIEKAPQDAIAWAVGTPEHPGYIGAAIQAGISKGLSGPDLATYAQQHGQVSVSPERAGANWNAMFGPGGTGAPAAGANSFTSGGNSSAATSAPNTSTPTQPQQSDSSIFQDYINSKPDPFGGLGDMLDKTKDTATSAASSFQDYVNSKPDPFKGLFDSTPSDASTPATPDTSSASSDTQSDATGLPGASAAMPAAPTVQPVALDPSLNLTMGAMQPGDDSSAAFGGSRPPDDRMAEPSVSGPPAPVAIAQPSQTTYGQDARDTLPATPAVASATPDVAPATPDVAQPQTTYGQDARDTGGQPGVMDGVASGPSTTGADIAPAPPQDPIHAFGSQIAQGIAGLVKHLTSPQNPTDANPGALASPASISGGSTPAGTIDPLSGTVPSSAQPLDQALDQGGTGGASLASPSSLPFGGSTVADAVTRPLAAAYSSPLRQELFPNIADPKHPFNVMQEMQDKYGTTRAGLVDQSNMTPEDRQRFLDASLAVGGVVGGAGPNPEGLRALTGGASDTVRGILGGTAPNAARSAGADASAIPESAGALASAEAANPPLTVYHATENGPFGSFDMGKSGSATDDGLFGRAAYFSTDPNIGKVGDSAKVARTTTLQTDVQLSNPLRLTYPAWGTNKTKLVNDAIGTEGLRGQPLTDALRSRGYDGVIVDYSPVGYRHSEVAVFDPSELHMEQQTAPGTPAPSPTSDLIPNADRARAAGADAGAAAGGLGVPESAGAEAAPEATPTSRFYHGTGSDFPRFEPGHTGSPGSGLFGDDPTYLTDNPAVASSYGDNRTGTQTQSIQQLQQWLDDARARGNPDEVAYRQSQLDATLAAARPGNNVRAVDVPQISDSPVPLTKPKPVPDFYDTPAAQQFGDPGARYRAIEDARAQFGYGSPEYKAAVAENEAASKAYVAAREAYIANNGTQQAAQRIDTGQIHLLDADALLPSGAAKRIDAALSEQLGRSSAGAGWLKGKTGEDAYLAIRESLKFGQGGGTDLSEGELRSAVNKVLADAGYDGIQYNGGRRSPMLDADGNPITHQAVAIFPSSLDKLRNAISGTQGGAASAQFASTLGSAAAGGGAAAVTTDPNDPNRGLKIAGGALAGAALGYGASRLAGIHDDVPAERFDAEGNPVHPVTGEPLPPEVQRSSVADTVNVPDGVATDPSFPQSRPVTPGEALRLFTTGNMISSGATMVHVGLSAFMSPAWALVRDTGRSLVTGNAEAIGPEWAAAGSSIGNAFADAARTAAFGRGIEQSGFQTLSGRISGSRPDQLAGKAAARIWETPGNLHGAMQQFAQTIVTAGETGRLAALEATNGGLKPNTPEWTNAVRALIADPPEPIAEAAQAAGLRAGTRAPLGKLAQGAADAIKASGPVGSIVQPIFTTPARIAARNIESSPLGLLGTLLDLPGYARGSVPDAVTPLGERLGNNILGTAAAVALVGQAMNGNITGDGPQDPTLMAELNKEGSGWQRNSIRVPGIGYVDYNRLGQLALPLRIAGNIADLRREALAGGDVNKELGSAAWRLANYVTTLPGIQEATDIFKIMGGGPQAQSAMAFQIAGLGDRLVPLSGAVGTVATATDPLARASAKGDLEQRSWVDLAHRIPGLREQTAPALTAQGTPAANPNQGLAAFIPRVGADSVPPTSFKAPGMPPKYFGVTDPLKEQQIDAAKAKMNAYLTAARAGSKTAVAPSKAEQNLALSYPEKMVNPAYTAAVKKQAETKAARDKSAVESYLAKP